MKEEEEEEVVVGGYFLEDLKLRQKCGKATVPKSTGQLISDTVPTDVSVCVYICWSVMEAFVEHRLSPRVPKDCVAIKLMMAS